MHGIIYKDSCTCTCIILWFVTFLLSKLTNRLSTCFYKSFICRLFGPLGTTLGTAMLELWNLLPLMIISASIKLYTVMISIKVKVKVILCQYFHWHNEGMATRMVWHKKILGEQTSVYNNMNRSLNSCNSCHWLWQKRQTTCKAYLQVHCTGKIHLKQFSVTVMVQWTVNHSLTSCSKEWNPAQQCACPVRNSIWDSNFQIIDPEV